MRRPVLLLLALAACVHVADDRARRDETVGQAEAAGASVHVEGGLATVRHFSAGELTLWAQAPALRIHLRPGATARWTVTVRNVLPDARLDAPVPFVEEVLPRRTDKRWTLDVTGGEVTLALAPPDADDTSPWRFAVLADVQSAIDRVQDIYGRMARDPSIRFVVMIGDLTEQGSAAQMERFVEELAGLPVPMYATLGNHDIGTRDDLFHEYFGRGSYSATYRGVRFTFLDSASATIAPRVHDWLDAWLVEGRRDFHVVLLHIPPLDPVGTRNGGFASRGEAHALVGKLARGGVDLTLYGHLHSYYAFENAGVPAYISGGGGAIPDRLDFIGRHYLTVDVAAETGLFQTAVVRVD
jgi:3',5'-cyclic-AMP phosphodiesterase